MKAIIIAAGLGARMGELTNNCPKCLLEINGISLLDNLVNRFQSFGIKEIAVVTGYCGEQINIPGLTVFKNSDYSNNNVLHSLMYARDFLDDDLLISYSDIWLEDEPISHLINNPGDLVLSVDSQWQDYYKGRTEHPVSEAENVIYYNDRKVKKVGKHLEPDSCENSESCGEFIGLFKLSKSFSEKFVDLFNELDSQLDADDPFQHCESWKTAYLTDFFSELISRDYEIHCSIHQKGWAEIDTVQDYERLNEKFANEEQRFRRKKGALILSEANDLKRTIPAMAIELNIATSELQATIDGERPTEVLDQVIRRMGETYPIDSSTLMLPKDDCDSGVRIMRSQQSATSSRIFERKDKNSSLSPYYEYRDTAMSCLSPFRPEWIKELRVVADNDPDNPAVVYNNGHFMHQITFFIGPVNFYWEVAGKKYCSEMNTGDSNYITPFWPHSFANRDPSREAIIIAVTFGGEVRRSQKELYSLGQRAENYLFNSRNEKQAYRVILENLITNEITTTEEIKKKVEDKSVDSELLSVLDGIKKPNLDELVQLAGLFDIEPSELLIPDYKPEQEVMVKKRDVKSAYLFPDSKRPCYRIYPAVRTPKMSGMKGFEIEVLAGKNEKQELTTSLHSYLYNFGNSEIAFSWNDASQTRSTILYPGDSVYLQPFVAHTFSVLDKPGNLIVVRIPGAINFSTQKELSSFSDAKRAFKETMCWFD